MCHFYISSSYKDIAEKYFKIPLTDLIKFAIILDDEKIQKELKKAYEDLKLFRKKFKLSGKILEEKESFTVCLPNKLLQNIDKNNMSRDVGIKLKKFLRKVCKIKIKS